MHFYSRAAWPGDDVYKLFLKITDSPSELGTLVQAKFRRVRNGNLLNRQQQQELSLGLTLVTISVLFIVCQSVKIVPDLYELFCSTNGHTRQSQSGKITCHSTKIIDTLIRFVLYIYRVDHKVVALEAN
jgi:hypothetical protein